MHHDLQAHWHGRGSVSLAARCSNHALQQDATGTEPLSCVRSHVKQIHDARAYSNASHSINSAPPCMPTRSSYSPCMVAGVNSLHSNRNGTALQAATNMVQFTPWSLKRGLGSGPDTE